jgi:glycosyltransferase involved in cell wall biosynthesis
MNNPLVSIIIPTYNRAEYLDRAVQSALSQTYNNIEVIVVDDASTDNTAQVVRSFESEKLRYIRNEENIGAPRTRNRGLQEANGEFVNFLDDDDELLPTKIHKQIQRFQVSNVDNLGVVTCDVLMVRDHGNELRENRKQGDIFEDLLSSYCVYGTETMLIRSDVLEDVAFDPRFASNQEYDLSLQMARKWSFDFVPELLTKKYESNNQISYNFDKKLSGTMTLWCKYKDSYWEHGVYAYNVCRFAYLLLRYTTGKYLGREIYRYLP